MGDVIDATRAKTPLQEWLVAGRKALGTPPNEGKPEDLARALASAGYNNGVEVNVLTIRGWEAPTGNVPPKAIPFLQRVFRARGFVEPPPTGESPMDVSALVTVIRDQTLAINRLVTSLRPPQTRAERVAALAAQIEALSAELEDLQRDEADELHMPPAPRRRRQG